MPIQQAIQRHLLARRRANATTGEPQSCMTFTARQQKARTVFHMRTESSDLQNPADGVGSDGNEARQGYGEDEASRKLISSIESALPPPSYGCVAI